MREDRRTAIGLGELRGEKQRFPSRLRAAMAIASRSEIEISSNPNPRTVKLEIGEFCESKI